MCVCVCFSETLENKRAWAPLAVLHAHKAYVATLFRSDSKFSLFMRSQPPTHLFCLPLFPRGPPLSLSLPLLALLLSLPLTHTLFPFQQPVPVQILSDFLSALLSLFFSPLSPLPLPYFLHVCSFFFTAVGGAIEPQFSRLGGG